VYQACFLNDKDPVESWKNLNKWQGKIIDYLSNKDRIKVIARNTELTLNVGGRTWINCDGQRNFPDGEVFTGPIENSINGHIRFTYPGIYMGKEIEDIYLEFKDGQVVKARAGFGQDLLNSMLNTDEGARYVGEFAIGTNYGIDRFTKNMLFDEKIGGTIHLALGLSIPESGGVNQSVIHWDMLCNMKDGGELYADDELFYKDGQFTKKF
ncbi:MAG: aminopeptidase, partial [bacterium]|nr:aminopeptidase [bacterium]